VKFERITVFTRDDYRGAQKPQRFIWREQSFQILEILDRWYEGSMDARRMPLRYFRVKTAGGEQFILRYHELFDAWSILVPRKNVEE
jgi:hypothetical protein